MNIWIVLSVIVCLSALFFWSKRTPNKSKLAVIATFDDCDAGRRLVDWALAHPGQSMADHPAGCQLIVEAIATNKEFIRTHPTIQGGNQQKWLYSLLTGEHALLLDST